ncbi:MAG: DNA phosphorothioation system restriction enzyme [Cyanobacteria bacterium]|nr:DNA phosphorothioation system restriction enzyme [Cyanobacteria bacterium CG_2015-16_32_12]NCO78428.1 DNA phosphorothioation system restriction enzyme [Cyanobacteria bacterium CG_2015-22_32_23]NCQ04815.1 DNA phosphorothioation system restriction enzyme [Cyanobacteria bacterium CG_2015-09_32_10]NCQ42053.1 DNA phosphorothioation system restriction enzyme [Cyanobacteria bacterium CG_2015-04_32_10]NCS84243.1 DNA phosphorothioation system restriction enzyme [Cyanobacteria bacterium CG_2015-02_32_
MNIEINKRINWDIIAQNYQEKNSYKLAEKKANYYYKKSSDNVPILPENLILRDYQKQAIINWFKNKGRGILKMATGSGKTITALGITTELYQQINLEVLLVICPFRHLVLQWAEEMIKFNLQPILAFENINNWQSELSLQLYNIHNHQQKFISIITTNSTFISDGFQSQIPFFPEKTLIIGDEAHNLGAPRLLSSLPATIGLRLALSATPERHFDEEGTDFLINYFGKVLQPEFTLANAIKKQALVKYNYHPILVELTDIEALYYAKLTKKIGWSLSQNNNLEDNHNLRSLLIRRSRLIATANNKLIALKELMSERLDMKATLFYCGDGYTNKNERQLQAVTRILGKELNYRVNTYTAETPLEERQKIKQQLVSGELQGIVAIRCLDEGIDIPMIENAVILASSSNPRQFIQRRGRILRPHEGKKEATLFDMIVIPPVLEREVWEIERNLIKKELKRFIEFASLANNAEEAKKTLNTLQQLTVNFL